MLVVSTFAGCDVDLPSASLTLGLPQAGALVLAAPISVASATPLFNKTCP